MRQIATIQAATRDSTDPRPYSALSRGYARPGVQSIILVLLLTSALHWHTVCASGCYVLLVHYVSVPPPPHPKIVASQCRVSTSVER